ncbi:hydroxyproline-rich glycoprotein family protein [Zea mays]|uniref:Hydroxyproline-rich glycoprotein family protein n=1 Tax=Zea mays TaxID=4577 RepID=A0A1D6IMI7_MAIZE|nr:hydroxyproline-rich glycoprotein family protein [Zea mays]
MSWFGHHHHNQPAPPASGPNQVFKIFCRANENYCLAVRDGAVVLAPVNPKDDHQHWYKDMRFSTRVKDEEGMPATSPCSGPRAATSATASAASAWSTTSTSTSTPSTATRPTAASMTVPRSCSGSGARATTSAGRSSLGERTKETTSWYPNNNSAGCGDPKIKEAGCDASRTSRVVFASDSQPLWG